MTELNTQNNILRLVVSFCNWKTGSGRLEDLSKITVHCAPDTDWSFYSKSCGFWMALCSSFFNAGRWSLLLFSSFQSLIQRPSLSTAAVQPECSLGWGWPYPSRCSYFSRFLSNWLGGWAWARIRTSKDDGLCGEKVAHPLILQTRPPRPREGENLV